MKDPHYQKILRGLAGPLDPQLFEKCVVDLLRGVYPGLVPVHGGQDYGMDGAVADGEGEAYPLIATTAQDVIGNLTTSLDSYLGSEGPRRRAVVATSTALTPAQRRNLERRASEKGFTLVQIHDRWDLASRLYRDSKWSQELLGITGEPSALSAIPETRRPLREDLELVGREEDLSWLQSTSGDRLVVGQPGSGKTYLLLQLVRAGKALFLASGEDRVIAEAVRDLDPEAIIVDDAHVDPPRLDRLRRMRREIGARFMLLTTTWPGSADDVAGALGGTSGEQIRHLEPLARSQILAVLRGIGIQEPDDDRYLRELVDQANNKPGLAVTLGSLWLRGEWRDVLTGEAIRRTLIPSLTRVLEHDPSQLLACFALGGDRGMSMEVVGDYLGLGRGEVYRQATFAAHGGVLQALGGDRLSVQPQVLRSALIREAFFPSTSQPALPYRRLLDEAANPKAAVEALTQAALRGVPVPQGELRNLVESFGSSTAWRRFALLGESQSRWVLSSYPGAIEQIAEGVLRSAPRAAVERLLREARRAKGPLHSQPYHPLRLLQDWLEELSPDPPDPLQRRQLVVDVAIEFLDQGGDRTVGLRACFLALSPRLERSGETVTGDAVTIQEGLLPGSTVPEFLKLWSRVRDRVAPLCEESWAQLEETLGHWVYPEALGMQVPADHLEPMHSMAERILVDLQSVAEASPGLGRALIQWAARIDVPLSLEPDPEFLALFPLEDHLTAENWEDERKKQYQVARQLAQTWASLSPEELIPRLARYEEEAQCFIGRSSEWGQVALQALAEIVDRPEEWLVSLARRRASPSWTEPFLDRVTREKRPGWAEILEECLESEEYSYLAGNLALRREGVSAEVLLRALEVISPMAVEVACQRKEIPLGILATLLRAPREEIALAAAVGEWLAEPRGAVRSELLGEWRASILRAGADGGIDRRSRHGSIHWLKEILESDPDLAFAWIAARLEDGQELEVVSQRGVYVSAIKGLSEDQRGELIERVAPGHFASQLLPALVEGSPELFDRLLAREALRPYHLAPLSKGLPETGWRRMAAAALEAGYAPEAIAAAAMSGVHSFSGFGAQYWSQWKQRFETLAATAQGRLREVGEHGRTVIDRLIARAEESKREHELTGEL